MKAFDAVFDSQRVYRALLRATASPGEMVGLPFRGIEARESVMTTLLDHEVTFCVLGEGAREAQGRIGLATGANAAPVPDADFALILEGGDGRVSGMKRGTLEAPADGATAVFSVRGLAERGPTTLSLSGPGVPGERCVGVEGLPAPEIEAIRESRSDYPMGVDIYLVSPAGTVVGLPRSTRLGVVR